MQKSGSIEYWARKQCFYGAPQVTIVQEKYYWERMKMQRKKKAVEMQKQFLLDKFMPKEMRRTLILVKEAKELKQTMRGISKYGWTHRK